MKLIMTLLVRNEEDILRANIDFHLAQGVDFVIATDNLSTDATTDILRSYENEGVLKYIHEKQDNYNQCKWVTRMARSAYKEFGADWVINNDADEFWWPREGDLKTTFEKIDSSFNAVVANRYNFVALDEMKGPFYSKMVYREKASLNCLGKPLPPKMAHRGCETINVVQGNHKVEGCGEIRPVTNVIDIFHFPIRSEQQMLRKIVCGGKAYQRNEELPKKVGNTWRELYRQYDQNGNLDNYFESQIYDESKINEALLSGRIAKDERLRDYMEKIYQ